ncbi:ABC transporter permease [Halomarina litorea]|uniref:ABC transporter permease n=1 Tax=Halomarina litorea TaxID=2961595 RepID=UPI0020C38D1A|nr:ABC transporter permease [Halomarina sp. BCD28]
MSDTGDQPKSGTDWSERARIALDRLVRASGTERLLISLAALVLSLLVGTVIILAAGRTATCQQAAVVYFDTGFCYDPARIFDRLFLGALGNPINPLFDPLHGQWAAPFREGWTPFNARMGDTLAETTVLVFTGLSVAVAFRAGIFNIGTQGQLVVGALGSTLAMLAVAPAFSGLVGTLVVVPFGLAMGALFGGLYGAIPGALKAYADANEVITTIMLNFVATFSALYLVQNHFKDPESPATKTRDLPAFADFPKLVYAPSDEFSVLAFAFALVVLVGVYLLLERTSFGYDLRTSGIQPEAAEYGGVDAAKTIVASMSLSGALGGIAGTVYVFMFFGYFQTGVPAYGFDGITVAILAGNNPLGVVPSAFLFGILKSGTISIQTDPNIDIPVQLVGVLRGLIILFVAMPEFFRLLGGRFASLSPRDRAVATDGGVRGGEDDE